jgi:hypothetical protein
MDPSATVGLDRAEKNEYSDEMRFFEKVVDQFGYAFKQHVKATFDAFVHLRHELPIADDGHRPLNDNFRSTIDDMLLATLDELDIPYHVVGGTLPERLTVIVDRMCLHTVTGVEEAIALAREDYAKLDMRLELERSRVAPVPT